MVKKLGANWLNRSLLNTKKVEHSFQMLHLLFEEIVTTTCSSYRSVLRSGS